MTYTLIILSLLGLCSAASIPAEKDGASICLGATLVYQYEGPIPVEKMKDVDHVHIISSKITVEKDEKSRLPHLLHLVIEKSNLNGQVRKFFEAMPSVNRLVLDNVNMERFTIEDLSVLRNLEVLSTKDQYIGDLKAESFKNFVNLRELFLISAGIKSIDERAFDSPNNVQVLDLSRNNLKKINKGMLSSLKKLRFLILDNNLLDELTPEQIPELPELEEIHVRGNKFTSIDIEQFRRKCPKLKDILV